MGALPTRIIKASVTYFVLAFGAGFVLGSIRVPFLVPRLGERVAELLEMPFMLIVIVVSARFITNRFSIPSTTWVRLTVGLLALVLLITTETGLTVALRGRTLAEYIASRDPVSGSVYLGMLALFAVMPLILTRVRWAAPRGGGLR